MLEELTSKIAALTAVRGGVDSSIKFITFSGDKIFIAEDGSVSNSDAEADCTIDIDASDLAALVSGDLNPMTAFMSGKLRVSGSTSAAAKLESLFGV